MNGAEKQEQPDKAIAAIEIATGSTVADIGAGVGYFSWRLAKVVGPAGKPTKSSRA
jgi:predicted methyltransferase